MLSSMYPTEQFYQDTINVFSKKTSFIGYALYQLLNDFM